MVGKSPTDQFKMCYETTAAFCNIRVEGNNERDIGRVHPKLSTVKPPETLRVEEASYLIDVFACVVSLSLAGCVLTSSRRV